MMILMQGYAHARVDKQQCEKLFAKTFLYEERYVKKKTPLPKTHSRCGWAA